MRRAFYRRQLPHLQRDFRPHFVTFSTYKRWVLPEAARDIVLQCCRHDSDITIRLHVSVVVPDHVHLIFTPQLDHEKNEVWSLARIMDRIKGASAHNINRVIGHKGHIWQAESFDHVIRSSESLDVKISYICANPVRAGLVTRWEDYPWLCAGRSKTRMPSR